jgi:hypothetical protein
MKQILSSIAIFFLLLLFLQSCGWESSIKKGNQSYALGEYYDAAKYYKKAYSSLPSKERKRRGEVAYKMADCYRLTNYTVRAKGAYMNAVRYKYSDSIISFIWLNQNEKVLIINLQSRTTNSIYLTSLVIFLPEMD